MDRDEPDFRRFVVNDDAKWFVFDFEVEIPEYDSIRPWMTMCISNQIDPIVFDSPPNPTCETPRINTGESFTNTIAKVFCPDYLHAASS